MKHPKIKINKRKYKYHHHHHRVYSISTVCLVGSKLAKIALATQIFVEPVGLDTFWRKHINVFFYLSLVSSLSAQTVFAIFLSTLENLIKKKIIYHSFVVILKQCRSLIYWVWSRKIILYCLSLSTSSNKILKIYFYG